MSEKIETFHQFLDRATEVTCNAMVNARPDSQVGHARVLLGARFAEVVAKHLRREMRKMLTENLGDTIEALELVGEAPVMLVLVGEVTSRTLEEAGLQVAA